LPLEAILTLSGKAVLSCVYFCKRITPFLYYEVGDERRSHHVRPDKRRSAFLSQL